MRRFLWLSLAVLATGVSAAPIKRATHPALSPDGSRLVFSWQNDLWIVSSQGGEARRLTVHPANDATPRWFPDGSRIAFTSNRFGSNDVYTIRPDGSDLRRLTFDSANEVLFGVTPDGKWVMGHTNAWGRANVFAASTGGSDLVRLTGHPLEMQYYPTMSSDGKRVAYVMGGSAGNWRNARENGTDTGEIWIADMAAPLSNNRNLTRDEHNDQFPMFGADGTITWVSNRSGWPNLWRMTSGGANARQLTQHTNGTVRWPNMSANGQFIAYEFDSELYRLNVQSGRSEKISIEVPEDQVLNPILDLSLSTGASDYVASPDGKRAVLVVRGELFLIPERGGTTRRLTNSPANDQNPIWLDNRRVLFVTGRNAKRELMVVDIEGNERPFLSVASDVMHPALSPDGKTIAFHRGDREIVTMPVAGGAPKVVATGGFNDVYRGGSSFSFSPDSKWITYAEDTERGSSVFVVELETGKKTLISRVARGASQPNFLPNGRGVYYTSGEFGGSDVVVVDLVPADLTFSEDDLDAIDVERPKPGPVEVKIDTRGIENRVRRLTNDDSFAVLASPDSRNIWAVVGGQLSAIPVSGGAATPVAGVSGPISSFKLAPNGSKVYLIVGGRPQILNLGNGSLAPVNFNAQMSIDRKAEEMALFQEIWWAMSRLFYDAKMHGNNWEAIRQEYAALVPFTFDRQDFYALMTEMIEEVDSSHLGGSAPPVGPPQANELTAFLGAEWDWAKLVSEGVYVVSSVLPGSPADHPMSRLQTGDRVLSVDGQALGKGTTFAEMLKGKVDRRVRLQVQRGDKTIDVAIRAASPGLAGSLRYEDFIARRRAEVERLSNGRLTYFHIQGMNTPSTDRFFREARMYAEGKSGAIVDVRWNGGGNTANRILAALRVEPWLIRRFRAWPDTTMTEEMFRGEALEMPVALMTNQYSASNAEIFSEGFRRMKLGPIIGEATGGNVLTVGGSFGLWDGGSITIPFIGIFTVDGESLEHKGRRVDVDVRYDPNAWNAGRDNQIEAAVRELMKRVR